MNDPQTASESPEPWEQQPGEPNRWYARFERFRLAGPSRSLLGAVKAEREQVGKRSTRSVPQAWAKAAQQWRWRERAEAWDAHERYQVRAAPCPASRRDEPPACPGSPRLAERRHASSL